jgi:hypothetical protein
MYTGASVMGQQLDMLGSDVLEVIFFQTVLESFLYTLKLVVNARSLS